MKKVYVLGSLNKDLVSYVNKVPEIGETVKGISFKTFNGGKGANQAVAIAKMNVPTTMLGAIGSDSYGQDLLKGLKEVGVNSNGIIKVETSSGISCIVVDGQSNNLIIFIPGANEKFEKHNLDYLINNYDNYDILVSQLEMKYEVVEEAFKISKKAGKINVLTPAPAMQFSKEILNYTDYLVPNETEFQTIFGLVPSGDNVKNISVQHPNINFIITLGENGILYGKNGVIKKFNALRVITKDTTAAGDSFLGAFVSQISKKNDIDKSIEFGIKAASITVGRKGAQASLPTFVEVEGVGNQYEK